MKKKIIFFAIKFLVISLTLNSQTNLQWAKTIGGVNDDASSSVTVDGAGNVYTTGYFNGTVDFDPGVGIYTLTSLGSDDVFISKLNASGNFVWAKQLGGANNERGLSITVDVSGNVYTLGWFGGITDFDPGVAVYNFTSAIGGSYDMFISKLDASGAFVYAKQFDGSRGLSIAVDINSNVYTAGSFIGTVDFNPGAGVFNLTAVGGNDIFISKLDAFGSFVFAKTMGGYGNDYSSSITIDAVGNIYTTGAFNGTSDFDPGAGVYNLATVAGAATGVFISKLDISGAFVWAKQLGGTAGGGYGNCIVVDGTGNVYTTGNFMGTLDFDPGASVYNLTGPGSNDV